MRRERAGPSEDGASAGEAGPAPRRHHVGVGEDGHLRAALRPARPR